MKSGTSRVNHNNVDSRPMLWICSRQRAPEQRQPDSHHRQQHPQGNEENADLGGFVLGDERYGQVLESALQLSGAFGRIVLPTGHGRNFLERGLIDAPAEPATAKASAPKTTAAAKGLIAPEAVRA